MTNKDDRNTTLQAIRERDPLRQPRKSNVKIFTAGEQATTTRRKVPKRRKARKGKANSQDVSEENNKSQAPTLEDPYERYRMPKTRCATYNIPVWVAENDGDPAFNVSFMFV